MSAPITISLIYSNHCEFPAFKKRLASIVCLWILIFSGSLTDYFLVNHLFGLYTAMFCSSSRSRGSSCPIWPCVVSSGIHPLLCSAAAAESGTGVLQSYSKRSTEGSSFLPRTPTKWTHLVTSHLRNSRAHLTHFPPPDHAHFFATPSLSCLLMCDIEGLTVGPLVRPLKGLEGTKWRVASRGSHTKLWFGADTSTFSWRRWNI